MSMQDKLKELRAKRKKQEEDAKKKEEKDSADTIIDMEENEKTMKKKAEEDKKAAAKAVQDEMEIFEDVKGGINVVRRNIAMINELKIQSNKTVDVKDFQNIMRKLDAVMNESKSNAAQVKTLLKKIDEENKDYPDGATKQMRINMVQTYTKSFADTMKEYSEASSSFQSSLKSRIQRQAQIIKPDVTDEELEKIEQNPQAFMQNAMLSGAMIDVISDIEDKHAKILEIERSVHYINELFHDLATLVTLQQEHLDLIETNVNQTKNLTQKGKEDLVDAHQYQQSSRKTQCIIVFVLIIILAAVLFPILKSKGVFDKG